MSNEIVNEIVDEMVHDPIDPVDQESAIETQEPEITPEEAEKQRRIAKSEKTKARMAELLRERQEERQERQAAQARADKLERELEELKVNKHQQQTKTTPTGAPDPEQYPAGKYDPDYLDALTDYKVNLRFKEQEQASRERETAKETAKRIETLEAKAIEAHDDFSEARTEFLNHSLAQVPAFMELLMDSDNPAELAYFLGKNPDELDKLGDMTPSQASRYIGRLEAKITETPTPEPGKRTVSGAPKPIEPLKGAGKTVVEKDPDKMTMDEFVAWSKKNQK